MHVLNKIQTRFTVTLSPDVSRNSWWFTRTGVNLSLLFRPQLPKKYRHLCNCMGFRFSVSAVVRENPSKFWIICGVSNVSIFFFYWRCGPNAGHGLLIFEVSWSHTTTASQSVGLLWTSDQLVAETFTWQHIKLTTNIHAPGGIRTHDLSRRAALYLRPRGHWDQLSWISQ